MRTWRDAEKKGKAALQKQVFVPWRGSLCSNLVAEPRLHVLAALLVAVAAGFWLGIGRDNDVRSLGQTGEYLLEQTTMPLSRPSWPNRQQNMW